MSDEVHLVPPATEVPPAAPPRGRDASGPRRILVIDDEKQQRDILEGTLSSHGYAVTLAEGVRDGLHLFRTREPDLVLLDVRLQDGDGIEACRKIRAHASRSSTPVILLTGQGEMDSKRAGFEAGADQYLVKPLHPTEVVHWVRALLKRVALDQGVGEQLVAGDLSIDAQAHLVRFRDRVISDLTAREFELFEFLVRRRPRVFNRPQLLSALWKTVTVDHVVDQHLYTLRRKLPRELAERIQSIPGKGFRYFE